MTCAFVSAPPRGHGPLLLTGRARVEPEDFVVDEVLPFEPGATGEHLYVEIEKRLENSEHVARLLAAAYDVAPVDVSYAGRKDRRAVARQWFSVRTPRDDAPELPGCRVMRLRRHTSKLRRGELAYNRFRIRLRDLGGDVHALDARLAAIAARGFPNYFGPQRFGHGGGNVARAFDYLTARPRRRASPASHGLHLSVARALLFNAVLAARVESASWESALPGDVVIAGRPTGPLWGRGRSPARDDAAAVEARALAEFSALRNALEHVGLAHARRSFVARPARLSWERQGAEALLDFRLGPGEYASVLLGELGEFATVAGDTA